MVNSMCNPRVFLLNRTEELQNCSKDQADDMMDSFVAVFICTVEEIGFSSVTSFEDLPL